MFAPDTAHAKNSRNGQWYDFDDNYVTQARAEDAKTNSSYVLFYQRRGSVGQAGTPSPAAPLADGQPMDDDDTDSDTDNRAARAY